MQIKGIMGQHDKVGSSAFVGGGPTDTIRYGQLDV